MSSSVLTHVLQLAGLLASLFCFICVVLICTHIYSSNKKWTVIETLTIISLSGFGISALSSAFYFMFDYCDPGGWRNLLYCYTCNAVTEIARRVAIVALFLLYLKRHQFNFDRFEHYATPRRIYRVFYALIAMVSILPFYWIIVVIWLLLGAEYETDTIAYKVFVGTIYLTQFILLIISIGLIRIHISKLLMLKSQLDRFKIVITPANTDQINDKSASDTKSTETNSVILKEISKLTVLSTLAIVSTQWFYTFVATTWLTRWFFESLTIQVIVWMGWSMDAVINALSLFLSFDFNDDLYQKWCCGLHRCCMCICDKCSQRRGERKANDLEEKLLAL